MAAGDYMAMPPVGLALDPEEERRRMALNAAATAGAMPAVALPGLQTSANGLPAPIANLIRNPNNLLMPTGQARHGEPLPQPIRAPERGTALNDLRGASMPAVAMPMEREPGSGLLLRGRAIAAAGGAPGGNQPGAMPAAAPAVPINPSGTSAQQKLQQDLAAGVQKRPAWRTILGAGLSGLAGDKAVDQFLQGPQQQFDRRIAADQAAVEQERQQGLDELNRRNIQSEIQTRENPPARETERLTPDEQTFAAELAKGRDPMEIFREMKQAGEKPPVPPTKRYERAQIEDPQKAGSGKEVLFDPAAEPGKNYIDPGTQQPIVNARPFEKANLSSTEQDVKDTAHSIIEGHADPVLTNYSYRDRTAILAELERNGYNQAQAEMDWKATQKLLSTLNGQQQVRLRQAVQFTNDSLPIVENLFDEWKRNATGFKAYNKAALAASKQLPGKAGEAAHLLEAQIADLTSELGTVYKGGNTSTDESLAMAAKNLQGDWNEGTFTRAIAQIRKNLTIRNNSILTTRPVGVSENSPYMPNGAGLTGSGNAAAAPPAQGKAGDPLGIF